MNNILNAAFDGLKVNNIENIEKVSEMLEKFGLRWSVSKQILQLPDGTPTKFSAIVRDDNNEVFASMKNSYAIYQNSELAELLIRISEKTGYEIKGGGSFDKGAKVFLQLKTGNELNGIGKNNDSVKGFITGINSHDGTTSLRFGSSNITISCKNTFYASYRSLQNRVKHTAGMFDKIDQYLMEVEGVVKEEKAIFEKFQIFSEIAVTDKQIKRVVKEVTGVDMDMKESEAKDKFSTYSINRMGELMDSIASEMHQKGNTLWGLFSGVTHYTTHKMPVSDKTQSKIFGTGQSVDNEIFALLG